MATQATQAKASKPVKTPKTKVVEPVTGSLYGAVEYATNMRLKRRIVLSPYYAKFFIPDENYTQLNIIGMQLGITWDEVLRGLIEMHLASGDQIAGLQHFVPALS